jgi:hypothetical protein
MKDLKIIDNDGFLALLDSKKYQPFVGQNWEFDQLMNHFLVSMNNEHILIWKTGWEGGQWNVNIVDQKTDKISFREFEGRINVSNGKLYLTEYADLTMAASFQRYGIPSKHNSNKYIELENGRYSVIIRQLFNPETMDEELEYRPNFELVINQVVCEDSKSNEFSAIPWYK